MRTAEMFYHNAILFLFTIICFSSASVVKFLPSTKFSLPINFKDGKLPCSKETVVFPDTLLGSTRLEYETSASGFILPRDGEIFLADGTINFGSEEADVNCTEGNVYYMERAVASWSQADVWSSEKFNQATPDAERMPCFDDVVEFPGDALFTLTLPEKTQRVAAIKIGNYSCYSATTFTQTITQLDLTQQFIYNSYSDVGFIIEQKQCQSRAGCPCQKEPLTVDCEAKYCSVPACVDPIKPAGHCCKICGGVISFGVDESFDLMTFVELVEKTVDSYGKDSLVYHIGRLPTGVQLVIVDKTEYSGISAEVVNDIDHRMGRHMYQGAKYMEISGSPIYKSGLGGNIVVSMFFLVVLAMGGIYVYYYKLPEIPEGRFPNFLHRSAPRVFSRFQNRTDSVVCLTRRDSDAPIGRGAGTAFKNPLYDSTRQRVEVEEIVANE